MIEAFSNARNPEVTRLCNLAVWKGKSSEAILTYYVEMMVSAFEHGEDVIRITERRRLVDPAAALRFVTPHLGHIRWKLR